MYVPLPYQENRQDVLIAAIRARAFGTLITADGGTIHLSHIPFVCVEKDGHLELLGHLARANPQGEALRGGADAVASFVLEDAYISPGWYPSKQEGGRVVPTWNYIAVEARGAARLVEEPGEVAAIVDGLTAIHEAGRRPPWSVADAPADYVAGLLKGIVGVALRVDRLTGAWKLDQKKSAADRQGAALALRGEGGNALLAARMESI